MKYTVTLGGRSFEVAVDGDAISVAGRTLVGRLSAVARSPLRRLTLDGVARTYALVRVPDGWLIQCAGRTWTAEVSDERTRSLRQLVGQGHRRHGAGSVRAPMPGLVLRVEVAEGERVAAGAGLVVLEAMKMENEIAAPAPGVVRRVHVRAGQAVEKGAELVEIADEQG